MVFKKVIMPSGNKIEEINGNLFINDYEIVTNRLKYSYYTFTLMAVFFSAMVGFLTGLILN